MSYIVEIKDAIRKLDSGPFQNLCDELLNRIGYSNIVGLGSKPGTNKTTLGTPDTYFCTDENDNYIFVEYTTQQESVYKKILSDISKCLDEEHTHVSCDRIKEIVFFHTTSSITPEQDLSLKELCKSKGILLSIFGIDYLADELFNNHKYLVKQHLGITIATEQILSYDDFIHNYNKAKTAAPIDTEFRFREKEIEDVFEGLNANKVVILFGVAGIGKTRLALECCYRYANEKHQKIYCIRNNNQPIYDDLHLYFGTPDKYIVLIDDANELTELETILRFFSEHDNSRFTLIITVRNYAAASVSSTVKSVFDIIPIRINRLKDDEIERLLNEELQIKNQLFISRIIKIAEGNARIAFLAGKVAVDADSISSIKDATDIYSSYYGKILSKVGATEKKLLSVAGIAAFVGPIHLDHLNKLEAILSCCDITTNEFNDLLYKLHDKEIINIYKGKAVRFGDQCLANYLLYYVFISEKWIKLSEMIRCNFKNNISHTIDSINVLINLFINEDNQDYLFSEIKLLWDELAEDDSPLFWEYVKVFYTANPTEALRLVHQRIESLPLVTTPLDDLIIEDKNNAVTDDIIKILGGYAQLEDLDAALDLYFIYFHKRPDMIDQFYFCAINNYGIEINSRLCKYNTLRKFIERIISKSNNWQDLYIDKLFVNIAKHFLKIHFEVTENKDYRSFTLHRIELVDDSYVEEYRNMLWDGLVELYSKGIEIELIESILNNYAHSISDKSKGVIEKDYPSIMRILDIFMEKESYYYCEIVSHLKQVYNCMEVDTDDDFETILNSQPYELYRIFGGVVDHTNTYSEINEQVERNVKSFVLDSDKQGFMSIVDFFCNSKVDISHYCVNALNCAFVCVLENTDYYADALRHYFLSGSNRYPLNPSTQIRRMFELSYSDKEVWSYVSLANDVNRNYWQYWYFVELPEKYNDSEHLQSWYEFLNNDSDKYITSSTLRDILFLKKYLTIDKNVVIRSCKAILKKRDYSSFIVKIYLELLLSELPERISEVICLFEGNYDLLSDLYLYKLSIDQNEDEQGIYLKAIYEKNPSILEHLFEQWDNVPYLRSDDTLKLSKLFELNEYEHIFDKIMEKMISHTIGSLIFEEEELKSIVSINNIEAKYRDRPVKWIKHYIDQHFDDEKEMSMISRMILGFDESIRINLISYFLSKNKSVEAFKNWSLFPELSSWIGSAVPYIHKRISFLNKLMPVLKGLDFLNHKKYIEDKIDGLRKWMTDLEIQEIISGLDSNI